MRQDRPELRIVEQSVWDRVQKRFASQSARRVRGAPRATYLLSGLVHCGVCGGRMHIVGNEHARYGCMAHGKRRSCDNALYVREQIARERIIETVNDNLGTPKALEFARERFAAHLRDALRRLPDIAADHERRARSLQGEIDNLVRALRYGPSAALAAELQRAEAELATARAEMAAARNARTVPKLPTDAQLRSLGLDVGRVLAGDVDEAREALRRWTGGAIRLDPQSGLYLARFDLFPGAVLLGSQAAPTRGQAVGMSGCGGRILAVPTGLKGAALPVSVALVAA
jgi:hypothetical protein